MKFLEILLMVTVTNEKTFQKAQKKLYKRLRKDNNFISKPFAFSGQEREKNIQELIQQYEVSLIHLENVKANAQKAVPYFEKINAELSVYTKEQELEEGQLDKSRQMDDEKIRKFHTQMDAIESAGSEEVFCIMAGLREMIFDEKSAQIDDSSDGICRLEEELEAAKGQKDDWDQKSKEAMDLKAELDSKFSKCKKLLYSVNKFDQWVPKFEKRCNEILSVKTESGNQYDKVKQAADVWENQPELLASWQTYETELDQLISRVQSKQEILSVEKECADIQREQLNTLQEKLEDARRECIASNIAVLPLEQKIGVMEKLIAVKQQSEVRQHEWQSQLAEMEEIVNKKELEYVNNGLDELSQLAACKNNLSAACNFISRQEMEVMKRIRQWENLSNPLEQIKPDVQSAIQYLNKINTEISMYAKKRKKQKKDNLRKKTERDHLRAEFSSISLITLSRYEDDIRILENLNQKISVQPAIQATDRQEHISFWKKELDTALVQKKYWEKKFEEIYSLNRELKTQIQMCERLSHEIELFLEQTKEQEKKYILEKESESVPFHQTLQQSMALYNDNLEIFQRWQSYAAERDKLVQEASSLLDKLCVERERAKAQKEQLDALNSKMHAAIMFEDGQQEISLLKKHVQLLRGLIQSEQQFVKNSQAWQSELLQMEQRVSELEKSCHEKAEKEIAVFNSLCSDFSSQTAGYISWKQKTQLSELYSRIFELYDSSYTSNLDLAQSGILKKMSMSDWRTWHNQEFVNSALKKYQTYFDQMLDYPLDIQQRTAVLKDEDYMQVVAGAGSGKTTTIVAKVKYLTEIKQISPEKILLLVFNRSAKQEMKKRICDDAKILVKIHTFHSFGLRVVRNILGNKKVHDEDWTNSIGSFVQKLIKKKSSESSDFGKKLLEFAILYQIEPKSRFDFDKMDTYYKMLGKVGYSTVKSALQKNTNAAKQAMADFAAKKALQGERVRSYEEFVIANYLYLNGIHYEYEREFPPEEWKGSDNTPYKPDFYLIDYDLYWEHFGVNKNEDKPYYMGAGAQKYIDDMNFKRKRFAELGRPLIESFSWQFSDNKIYDYLDRILEKYHIQKKPIAADEIVQSLLQHKSNRLFNQSTSLIESYLSLYKSRCLKKEDMEKAKHFVKCKSDFEKKRTELFFEVFKEIFDEYEKELSDKNEVDFDDMIVMATEQINSKRYQVPFDYIIVDEYQDLSFSRQKLLEALVFQKQDTKLFGVGDDWQSIYGFTGCDIDYFVRFRNYWPHSLQLKIEQTHRNSQQLVNIAGNFIMKNHNQIPKKLKSSYSCSNPILILQYQQSEEKTDQNEGSYHDKGKTDQNVLSYYAVLEAIKWLKDQQNGELEDKDILILGRNNSTVENIKTFLQNQKYSCQYSTVHRSKGSEAKAVVLADVLDGIAGFPNQMADDPILQSLLAKPEEYAYAQERRLFYVALTRTKKQIVITTDKLNPSCFVNELMQETDYVTSRIVSGADIKEYVKPPVCKYCKGQMVRRQNRKSGEWFWGCSNYSRGCNYTQSMNE